MTVSNISVAPTMPFILRRDKNTGLDYRKSLGKYAMNIHSCLDRKCATWEDVSVKADTIATIVDLQKEADVQASEFLKEKWKAMELMEQIRPESSAVLIARYFEGKTYPEIGHEQFITERQAQRKEKNSHQRVPARA